MAVLSAIIAIGAVAATNQLGFRVRDAYCKVVGVVVFAQSPTNTFDSSLWGWQDDGKSGGRCDRLNAW